MNFWLTGIVGIGKLLYHSDNLSFRLCHSHYSLIAIGDGLMKNCFSSLQRNSSSRISGIFCRPNGDLHSKRSPWMMCMRFFGTSNVWPASVLHCRWVCFAFSDVRRSTNFKTRRRRWWKTVRAFTTASELSIPIIILKLKFLIKGIFRKYRILNFFSQALWPSDCVTVVSHRPLGLLDHQIAFIALKILHWRC